MTDMIYKRVELVEDALVQFVAVHPVRWRPEWGEPSVGFVEDEETAERLAELEVANAALTAENARLRQRAETGEAVERMPVGWHLIHYLHGWGAGPEDADDVLGAGKTALAALRAAKERP